MKEKLHYIYLVDDDKDDRELFSEALGETSLKTEIATFNNGVDLMANLLDNDQKLPDVIFLDLNMPLMNGEECLADIRREPQLYAIPIVIYSTFFDEYKVDLLRQKGADRYLQKPSSYDQLKFFIERTIESLEKEKSDLLEFVIK